MKKTIATVLCLAMLASCFALLSSAENPIDASENISVKASYVTLDTVPEMYAVDIDFGSMEFTYEINLGAWNPEIHDFDDAGAAWICAEDANRISITNHSNIAIEATLSYNQGSGYESIGGSFDKSTLELDSAVDTLYEEAPADKAYLTLSGEYGGDETFVKVGTVTVTITKA